MPTTKCTVWNVLLSAAVYDGSPTAHQRVTDDCKKYAGKTVKPSDEWSVETIMAVFGRAGGLDLIGGYVSDGTALKKNAEKLGIWKSGSGDILPGDIVLYGKNGKADHAELSVGSNTNISGNYTVNKVDGVYRRKRSGRTVIGRARPKYTAMGTMDNLQYTIAAVDCMLGVYGSGATRKTQLSVFGEKNIELIQNEIDRVWGDNAKVHRDMAVYIIAGMGGAEQYRKTRLGSWADDAQKEVNSIARMRGKTVAEAANDVLDDKYGKEAVRILLLAFNGYDAQKVQVEVDRIYAERKKADKNDGDGFHPRIRVWGIWFFEGDEKQYGDATAIIQYGADDKTIEHVVLIDTAKKTGKTVKKLKAAGIKTIDAVVISHAHGDHYGALSDVFTNFAVKSLYLPNTEGLDKYQKSYADALRSQEKKAKKYGASCTYLRAGMGFTIGKIHCDCVWQAPASALSEKDDHHFVNNQSIVTRFTLDGRAVFHSAGDLQNPGNNLLVKAVKNLRADILKTQWHGDANACNATICAAIKPKIAFSNYHHEATSKNGRSKTQKRLEAVGAVMARNWENGDIYIDCRDGVMTLTCSKGNLNKRIPI